MEREREARERAERLLAAARAVTASIDLPSVLAAILAELRTVVPYDSASVQEWRVDRLVIVAAAGFADPASILGVELDVAGQQSPNTRQVFETRAPLILEDAWSTFSGFRGEPHAQAAIRSWLGVPLLFGDRLIGLVTLDKKEAGFYTADHATVAVAFAAQAAIAMENARLFAAAQHELAERRRMEVALRESEARYREVVETAADVIYRLDTTGRFTYVNPTAARLLGFSDRDATGRPYLDFVPARCREEVGAFYMAQYFDLVPNTYREIPIQSREGGERWFGCSVQLLLDASGMPAGFQVIARDVTDRKVAEEALRASDQMRQDLVRTMVHDLRTPLTSILGALEAISLVSPGSLGAHQEEMLAIADRNGRRLLDLIQSILDVSRLESGAMTLRLEDVSLAAVTAETVELQRPVAAARGLILLWEAAPGLPAVRADRMLIGRVMENLVGNALKFTPEGGRVRVACGLEPSVLALRIIVEDDGPGIPAGLRSRLFQKFAAGDQAQSGSGLGLAFCRLAVETHGGTIDAEEVPGGGTRMVVTFPAARDRPADEV